LIPRLLAEVSAEQHFLVERVHIDLVGLCDHCQAQLASGSVP
jgi:Fe2+ or Zn2+ uptake regulation protein